MEIDFIKNNLEKELERINLPFKKFVNSSAFQSIQNVMKEMESVKETIRKPLESFKALQEDLLSPRTQLVYHRPVEYDIRDELVRLNEKFDQKNNKSRESYPLPIDAKWCKLKVKFFDGHTIKVSYEGMPTKTFDYKDMGFLDKKTNNPDTKWNFLRAIAENQGSLNNSKFNRKFSRNAKYELNSRLKSFFCMNEDPITRYNKVDGYRVLFNISSDTNPNCHLSEEYSE